MKSYEYICDLLFLNILDQIWIQEVFEPHIFDIGEALKFEIKMCHEPDRIDELFMKRNILAKLIK